MLSRAGGPAVALDQGNGEMIVVNIKLRALGSAFCLPGKPAASKLLHPVVQLSVGVQVQGV